MKRKTTSGRIACLASAVALALPASAAPVTITNPGFEDPVLEDGLLGTSGSVPGWTVFNSADIRVLNPSSANDLTLEAPDGQNVGLATSSANEDGFSQTLASTFQADADYALTVKVANTKFTTGFPGYRVQLLAGGTVLNEDDNSQVIAEDTVVTSTVNYSYNAGLHAGLVGQPLEIRLLSKGIATTQEVAFDDVQLSVSLLNPVANPGGPYTVPIAGSLSLDGTGSLPSDGQTITLYEWDLDNDGDFDEAITGGTPASITYTDLQTTYGMAIGANTIKLKVTDSTAKTSTAEGIVNLAPPIGCQLGVLDLDANGGINPNTGNPWQLGDKYRIAFHTLGTTVTTSNDPNFYNDFATAEAWTVPALQGTYWRAMVTVSLDPTTTQALSPRSEVKANTGTGDLTGGSNQGGAGEPVYVVNGTTCIARNNADIWNAWSNPFENSLGVPNSTGTGNNTQRVTGVYYSPFLDQNGNQTVNPDAVHGKDVATGCDQSGNHVNALGNNTDNTTIARGNSNANNTGRAWNRFTDSTTTARSVYAISVPLTIINLADSVDPSQVSIVDNRSGADVILGVDTVTYTVTFSEPIDASTLTVDDFENIGTAGATISKIRGSLNPAAFEVTVIPTTSGTLRLQTKAGAVIEDPVGNPVDTSTAIPDDTTINVLTDTTAPTLVSIEDNLSGGPVVAFNPVTYTVTLDEGINASTVNLDDFGNGGTAPVNINSVSPTGNPAVFTVVATPTAAGTLTLEIVAGATITDFVGNALVTTSALPDDTTITVDPDPLPTLVSITDNQGGGPVFAGSSFAYTVTFSQAVIAGTVDVTDFENGGSPAVTVNAVAATSNPAVYAVHVTPGGAGTITLQVKAGAVITNLNGTALDTTVALADDTMITVSAGSGPARGTITFNGPATFTSANSGTLTRTFDASGSDKLVVIVTGENGNPGDLNGNSSSVTYDGTPLTKVIDRNPIGGTPIDQTFNDIWYLDNPGSVHTAGAISATVNSRGSITVFGLSGTAPGVGQTAISPQASKSVVLSTTFANSIVIASHGMGGDGNSANVTAVDAVLPLIETSATAQASGSPSPWDGHVTAYALMPTAGTATHSFTGGNLVGSHTIAVEFLAAEDTGGGNPYTTWATTNAPTTGNDPSADEDGDGVSNGVEFVLGGDKDTNDLDKLPTVGTSGGNLTFSFVRDQDSIDASVAVSIEVGTDLATWPTEYPVPNTATAGPPVAVVDNADGTDTITLTVAQAPDAKKFARLKVVIAP